MVQVISLPLFHRKYIPGNVPWFMTDSIAVLEDGYSEVVMNARVEVAALLADVGRPHMMTTNSTGDRFYFCNCEHEPWQCHKRSKTLEGASNCVRENTPPPIFELDVVYKTEGRINGTLRYYKLQYGNIF